MAKKKKDRDDSLISDEDVLTEEVEGVDDTGDTGVDLDTETMALGEDTGESTVPEATAEEQVATQEGNNMITLTETEVPQLSGLEPGDTIDLVTTFTVKRGADGSFDLEPTDFLPTEEIESPEMAEEPAVPPAQAVPGGPAGPGGESPLAGIL